MNYPQLLTLEDLKQEPETKAQLIERAKSLSHIYTSWQETNYGSYTIEAHLGSRERRTGVHASELASCLRKVVYNLRKEPTTLSRNLNMQRRMDLGTLVHSLIQTQFHEMCGWVNDAADMTILTFEPEVEISPEMQELSKKLNLHSHCDGQFLFWYNGKKYLRVGLEIKTKSGPEYEKLKKPDPEHLDQTCFYQAALDLPLMWVLYYNKSNSNYTEAVPPYFYEFDDPLWTRRILPRIESAHQHLLEKTFPDREEGMHCQWCPWAEACRPKNSITGSAPPVHNPTAWRGR